MNDILSLLAMFFGFGFVFGWVVCYAFRKPWTQADVDAIASVRDPNEAALFAALELVPKTSWELQRTFPVQYEDGSVYCSPTLAYERQDILIAEDSDGGVQLCLNTSRVRLSRAGQRWLTKFFREGVQRMTTAKLRDAAL